MTDRNLILRDWLETTFREAILDDERVLMAAAMLKVGHERGDPGVEVIRRCIAVFVHDLIAPGDLDQDENPWLNRN